MTRVFCYISITLGGLGWHVYVPVGLYLYSQTHLNTSLVLVLAGVLLGTIPPSISTVALFLITDGSTSGTNH